MVVKRTKALEAYLDALAERDGAVAALEFLPDDLRTECETHIHALNVQLARKAVALDEAQKAVYNASLDARRHNVADLIAHLERMRPYVASLPSATQKLGNIFSESIRIPNTETKGS